MIPQTAAQAEINAILDGFAARSLAEITLGLDRIEEALARLGNPHHRLPPVLHVAGTNGKGSTCAFLGSILKAAGLKVHIFTSPHLVRFNERITLAGEPISDDLLAATLGRCEAAAGDLPLSYFEAVTASAFLAFAETAGDVVILETGLGGRLDATNVIDHPRAAIITPIALDHQRFLGTELADIAFEKAGILKAGAAFVTGAQRHEALPVLKSRALAIGAHPHVYGEDWSFRQEAGRLVYEDEDGLRDLGLPRLAGSHQVENAALAVAALKAGGLLPDDQTASYGIETAFWPARLQRLTRGPLVDRAQRHAGEHAELWLDGGHNPHAARALARALADLDDHTPRPVILIVGMQENKDAEGFFAAFEGLASAVFTVEAKSGTPVVKSRLAEMAQKAGLPAVPVENIAAGIDQAVEETGRSGEGMPRILICGSLYLAGHVLEENS
ncbi:FolC bifunctional protein [Parvularcula bermudensis HTCC2503]|uniref:Dihydrofolate synthase/folylpolyglutamate synthase n=1 Tax=Parvularcula bermudensis (strain ATCC BAA-594 / HTCC2503 / KCTC 12087) TaxID=314260 RepID=E0TF72_PARBH|nr:folylpolyglutamate synthase/dihydrofolate synthase family protein [Parvularcula bermudensis]ADM08990.1 FolC bifunctional protein [Parvularcula bermudensis HTCC2503]